jgi:hypothetical protein
MTGLAAPVGGNPYIRLDDFEMSYSCRIKIGFLPYSNSRIFPARLLDRLRGTVATSLLALDD